MKACPGYILRNITGEYLLMPAADKIGKLRGAVLMNESSALVWEMLQKPVTRDELLAGILDTYEIDEATAAADLDALLAELKRIEVIEE